MKGDGVVLLHFIVQMINKNVLIVFGEDQLDEFYKLYAETMRRNEMHLESLNEFKLFMNGMRQNLICGVAYSNPNTDVQATERM